MAKFTGYVLSISLLVTLGWADASAASRLQAKQNPLVTVRIYDHAKLRPTTLRKAEKEAARIFRLAGIDTIWLHCPLTEEELAGNRVCERDFGKSSLVLRILPESKARVLARDPREFGIAHLSERGGFATDASVFSHRAAELAETIIASKAVVLGHVLAHEMGHLLLGAGRHSSEGLMMAGWRAEQLHHVSKGQLVFTPKQAARMLSNVRKRAKAGRAK